jgi:hypothetical protein
LIYSTRKKGKFIAQKVYFCEYNNYVYLIVQDKDSGKIIRSAKSDNGFQFRKVRVKEAVVKQYPLLKEKRRAFIQRRYAEHLAPLLNLLIDLRLKCKTHLELLREFWYFTTTIITNRIKLAWPVLTQGDEPKLIWRHQQPVWEMRDQIDSKKIEFIDLIEIKGQLIAYWW